MNNLSKEKLNYYKNKKNLTNNEISKKANIPISNIDKIFSGKNLNPTLNTIQKIAQILDCAIDDLIESSSSPQSPIHVNSDVLKLIGQIKGKKKYIEVLKMMLEMSEADFNMFYIIARKFTKPISKK